jgi:uncharacterized membrane protein
LSKFIRSNDIYGHKIGLSFKGETTHKTILGGIFTIMANIIIVSFFIYQVLAVTSNSPIINNSYYSRDLTSDLTIISLNASNFDFAISMSSYSEN